MRPHSYETHEDILFTENGYAFLIGGNHSVLNYITGAAVPNPESLDNFRKNLETRSLIANSCDAKFAHVIFPDKQSVLTEEFPIKNIVRLGELYTNNIVKSDQLIYPIRELQDQVQQTYLELDTHLTDHGSLHVLALILKAFNLSLPQTLNHLKSRIILRKQTTGDLGSKFSPVKIQSSVNLVPDWDYQRYSSNGGYNNGQVDICFSASADVEGTLLIFGDSFLRLMLPMLSRIFRKIVFLRTPFVHHEMVSLINPDFILSGNAERYLAHVSPDSSASPFFLYSLFRDNPQREGLRFLQAYKAVLTPNATTSKKIILNALTLSSNSKLIVGPSHVVRWKNHCKNELLCYPLEEENFVGFGGAPLWSRRLFEDSVRRSSDGREVLLLVPDFRFGNSICLETRELPQGAFIDNHSGINSSALSPQHDRFMTELCNKALPHWRNKFPHQIKFLFWDLLCRQIQDRLSKKHIVNKAYRHPSWNLDEVQRLVPEDRLINLAPLLKKPMHDLSCLYIDSSSHPSHIGYQFITYCYMFKLDVITSFELAKSEIRNLIIGPALELLYKRKKPLVVAGRSVWIDNIVRYLGSEGITNLLGHGMCIIPLFAPPAYPKDDVRKFLDDQEYELLLVSENGTLDTLQKSEFTDIFNVNKPVKAHIAWESSCVDVIKARGEQPLALSRETIISATQMQTIPLSDGDIELGPYCYPTTSGFSKLFTYAARCMAAS